MSTDLDVVEAMDFTEDNRYLVCALMGTKEIAIYRLTMEGGSLYKHFPVGLNGMQHVTSRARCLPKPCVRVGIGREDVHCSCLLWFRYGDSRI